MATGARLNARTAADLPQQKPLTLDVIDPRMFVVESGIKDLLEGVKVGGNVVSNAAQTYLDQQLQPFRIAANQAQTTAALALAKERDVKSQNQPVITQAMLDNIDANIGMRQAQTNLIQKNIDTLDSKKEMDSKKLIMNESLNKEKIDKTKKESQLLDKKINQPTESEVLQSTISQIPQNITQGNMQNAPQEKIDSSNYGMSFNDGKTFAGTREYLDKKQREAGVAFDTKTMRDTGKIAPDGKPIYVVSGFTDEVYNPEKSTATANKYEQDNAAKSALIQSAYVNYKKVLDSGFDPSKQNIENMASYYISNLSPQTRSLASMTYSDQLNIYNDSLESIAAGLIYDLSGKAVNRDEMYRIISGLKIRPGMKPETVEDKKSQLDALVAINLERLKPSSQELIQREINQSKIQSKVNVKTPEMVRVVDTKGRLFDLPKKNLEKALKQGYALAD